jgi:hypothetical protein
MSKSFVRASATYQLNSAALVTAPQNMSISMWFRPASTGTTQYLAGVGASGSFNGAYIAMVGGNSLWAGSFATPGGGNAAMSAASTITPGNWYFVGGVWTPALNRRKVYFNGLIAEEFTAIIPGATNRFSLGTLYWNGAPDSNHFDGDIAHVGLWPTELSDAEMASLAAGRAPKKVRPQALADFWGTLDPGADSAGVRGNVMTGVNSPTASASNPRVYQ